MEWRMEGSDTALWLTVDTSTLKNGRNEYEYQALVRLADALPADIKVCWCGRPPTASFVPE